MDAAVEVDVVEAEEAMVVEQEVKADDAPVEVDAVEVEADDAPVEVDAVEVAPAVVVDDQHAELRNQSMVCRDAAAAFASAVFQRADKNGEGTLSKSEVRKYFQLNPEDKQHIV